MIPVPRTQHSRASWGSLANNSRFTEKLVLKRKVESDYGRHLKLTHTHTLIQKDKYE